MSDFEAVDGRVQHQNYPIRYIPRTCLCVWCGRSGSLRPGYKYRLCIIMTYTAEDAGWFTGPRTPIRSVAFYVPAADLQSRPRVSTCSQYQTSLWANKAAAWQGNLHVISNQTAYGNYFGCCINCTYYPALHEIRRLSVVNRLQGGSSGFNSRPQFWGPHKIILTGHRRLLLEIQSSDHLGPVSV